MSNPFEKRATEYLRDASSFLSVFTPEPLESFLGEKAQHDVLLDRLTIISGTPGSGKTTIATLLQFNTIETLFHKSEESNIKDIRSSLLRCKFINDSRPLIIGCRIPMESEYKDFWELPYRVEIKLGLLRSFIQARAVILWIRSIKEASRYDPEESKFVFKEEDSAAVDSIGGQNINNIYDTARLIEAKIYAISAALIPPNEEDLDPLVLAPYQPFSIIKSISLKDNNNGLMHDFRPLVIFDDVHSLYPSQIGELVKWLAQREIRIARWMLQRFDAQDAKDLLLDDQPNLPSQSITTPLDFNREITSISMQSMGDRAELRRTFRKMAKGMADKYLNQMSLFSKRGIYHLSDILSNQSISISQSQMKEVEFKIQKTINKGNIGKNIYIDIENEIERYSLSSQQNIDNDIKLMMKYILLNRYLKRVPQASLFESIDNGHNTPEPKKILKADSTLADGAKIHLLHLFNRPYYYGIDILCDAGSENAELFLHYAGYLVRASETRIIRGDKSILSAEYQHRLLIEKSKAIISNWAFPNSGLVKQICEYISEECLTKSLEANASLGGGANAIGVTQESFDETISKNALFAQVFQYAIAYNVLIIKRDHSTKYRTWVLIELTAPYIIYKNLTFARGGFLEKEITDLLNIIEKTNE
jgi:hypothetical protein